MDENKAILLKWLKYLMYLHIASLGLSAVNVFVRIETLTTAVGLAISIGAAACLLQLRHVNPRYQKSAVVRSIMIGCILAVSLLGGPVLLTNVGSVCAFVADYQEYHGHGEMVEKTSRSLAQKWNSLFLWALAVGLISGFAVSAVVMIGAVAGAEVDTLTVIAAVAVLLANAVIDVLYLRNMKNTLAVLETEEM